MAWPLNCQKVMPTPRKRGDWRVAVRSGSMRCTNTRNSISPRKAPETYSLESYRPTGSTSRDFSAASLGRSGPLADQGQDFLNSCKGSPAQELAHWQKFSLEYSRFRSLSHAPFSFEHESRFSCPTHSVGHSIRTAASLHGTWQESHHPRPALRAPGQFFHGCRV